MNGRALDPAIERASTRNSARTSLRQLAEVHLRHHHLRVAGQHLAEVGRERVEVGEVGVGHPPAAAAEAAHGAVDGAPGRAPPEHEQLGVVDVAGDLDRRDVGGDAGDLGRPGA